MNRCPRAVSARIYVRSCFLFVSPSVTVEATKHHGGLVQIKLSRWTSDPGYAAAACLMTLHT